MTNARLTVQWAEGMFGRGWKVYGLLVLDFKNFPLKEVIQWFWMVEKRRFCNNRSICFIRQ